MKDPLIQFFLPLKGLYNGLHEFHFTVDGAFFKAFEFSPVQEGQFEVALALDKRSDMLVLDFSFEGTVLTDCDRCLAAINLPLVDEQRLLIKYSLDETVEEAEVVFISPETPQLNVAPYIYEFILLAMPLIRTYDCASAAVRPCNEEMLRYLAAAAAPEVPESETPLEDPLREALKNWNKNN